MALLETGVVLLHLLVLLLLDFFAHRLHADSGDLVVALPQDLIAQAADELGVVLQLDAVLLKQQFACG